MLNRCFRQFSGPSGLLGQVAGRRMARMNRPLAVEGMWRHAARRENRGQTLTAILARASREDATNETGRRPT